LKDIRFFGVKFDNFQNSNNYKIYYLMILGQTVMVDYEKAPSDIKETIKHIHSGKLLMIARVTSRTT